MPRKETGLSGGGGWLDLRPSAANGHAAGAGTRPDEQVASAAGFQGRPLDGMLSSGWPQEG